MKEPSTTILVVEDSKMFAHAITTRIEADLNVATRLAASCAQAREMVEGQESRFFAAVLDLTLPDAPKGEIVDYILDKKIPAIVLTSRFSQEVRRKFSARNIVDYILKEGPHSLDHLTATLLRLQKNRTTKILVVDDSKAARQAIKSLLARHQFIALEASNGRQALGTLASHPDIKVVITDYHMPEMDGFELIHQIRQAYAMDQMAIIGISGNEDATMPALFLKKGANDFMVKPFFNEEFYLRINQNLQMLDYIESIRMAAIKDHLTGLYNRRYFFEVGLKLFENARRKESDLALAMIDIDYFKRINDEFGHAAGDEVLRHIASILEGHFRASDVVARLGGEEFCILAPNMDPRHAPQVFERLRSTIESQPVALASGPIRPTISIGVATTMASTLDATLNCADQLLYQAKSEGRNRAILNAADSAETGRSSSQ